MRIAADINIPCIDSACTELGELRFYDSRYAGQLQQALQGADVLLCRSTIRVGPETLEGSNVRFVATATSGTDHLDVEGLTSAGINVASAAGSNARSVAEYVIAAILDLMARQVMEASACSIGIVGVGHVGSQVMELSEALGFHVYLNDPPREDRGETHAGNHSFVPLPQVLKSDIVSLHVPLTDTGFHPTRGLMSAEHFGIMRDNTVFVNTARGDVMNTAACMEFARRGAAVLDVFPGEPEIDPELLNAVDIATPHIAGHSLDGKLLGTQMLYDALCEYLGRVPTWRHEQYLPQAPALVPHTLATANAYEQIAPIVHAAYNVTNDDAALRTLVQLPPETRGGYFSRLRAEYAVRREFHRIDVHASHLSNEASEMLRALGFRLR